MLTDVYPLLGQVKLPETFWQMVWLTKSERIICLKADMVGCIIFALLVTLMSSYTVYTSRGG